MVEQIEQEIKPKMSKLERMLKITFYILFISCVLLLGAWFAKLIGIAFR